MSGTYVPQILEHLHTSGSIFGRTYEIPENFMRFGLFGRSLVWWRGGQQTWPGRVGRALRAAKSPSNCFHRVFAFLLPSILFSFSLGPAVVLVTGDAPPERLYGRNARAAKALPYQSNYCARPYQRSGRIHPNVPDAEETQPPDEHKAAKDRGCPVLMHDEWPCGRQREDSREII